MVGNLVIVADVVMQSDDEADGATFGGVLLYLFFGDNLLAVDAAPLSLCVAHGGLSGEART